MSKTLCPMSDMAIEHIKSLTESYKMAIEAADEYKSIILTDKKQLQEALELADHLRRIIESYLCSWENGSPCLVYSCGWEYCKKNLLILDSMPNLPDLPSQDYSNNINITTSKSSDSNSD
jgi:hypothetical protein